MPSEVSQNYGCVEAKADTQSHLGVQMETRAHGFALDLLDVDC